MQPGEAWYTNVNLPHSVENKGQTNRVHLVIDCIRNEWSDELFKSMGYDFSQEKEIEESFSKSEVLRIIEELEFQDTAESRRFLEEFKRNNII
jgi:Mg/Co/Ni transporter MgtE